MGKKTEKKQTGKVNYVWVLAGGYLIYLAVKTFGVLRSGASDYPIFALVGGLILAVVGALVLLREWKAYQYGVQHIDDPSTWSDEEDEEPSALPEKEGEDE